MPAISDHLAVGDDARDLPWLREALQIALALEAATLPLYLSAMYSLRVQSFTAYNLIRSVAMEEMVHMAIAANSLAAVGATPAIRTLGTPFPAQGLPGGAEPDLHARLAPLSKAQLRNFMRVELPGFLAPPELADETYPTIGRLYGAIVEAIDRNADAIRSAARTSNQVGDDIGFTAITADADPVPQLKAAIAEVTEQGEGSPARTLHADPTSEGEESHYCKFAELYYGGRYEPVDGVELTRETEPRFFGGYRIPFPEVVNTLAVPADGYAQLLELDPAGAEVEQSLTEFDGAYTSVLADLDATWNGPTAQSWPTLGRAVTTMGTLRVLAGFKVIQHAVPAAAVARLDELYPDEYAELAVYTNLDAPVFYGPRFVNLNVDTSV